jgi:hypothetical protein
VTAAVSTLAELLLTDAAIERAAGAIFAECYPTGTFKGAPKYMRTLYVDQARAALSAAIGITP